MSDINPVEWAVKNNADGYFSKLGYSGNYPDYHKEIPGKIIAVQYLLNSDSEETFALTVSYAVADKKKIFDSEAANHINEPISVSLLREITLGRAYTKSLKNLPSIKASNDSLGDIDKKALSEILMVIPVVDKLACNTRTDADDYASKCRDIAKKNKNDYDKQMAEYEALVNELNTDREKEIERRNKSHNTSFIVMIIVAGIIAYGVACVASFAYLREYSDVVSIKEVMTQWYTLLPLLIAELAALVGGIIGNSKVLK